MKNPLFVFFQITLSSTFALTFFPWTWANTPPRLPPNHWKPSKKKDSSSSLNRSYTSATHPLFRNRHSKQKGERVTQSIITTPRVQPKSGSSSIIYEKHNIVAQPRTFLSNLLPQPHTKTLSTFPGIPLPFFHSILPTNNLIPNSLLFYHKAPTPFTQKSSIKSKEAFYTQTSFTFIQANNRSFNKMNLPLQSPPTPKEIPLDLLKTQSNWSRHTQNWHMVNRYVRQSVSNESESPFFRYILSLP